MPNAAVPAAAVDCAIPIDQLPPEGRELYDYDIAAARRLAQAGIPAGFKVPVETTWWRWLALPTPCRLT